MINTILEKVLGAILNWLAARITAELKAKKDKLEADKEASKTDAKNVEEYEKAKSRAEQIAAAKRLLDGTDTP